MFVYNEDPRVEIVGNGETTEYMRSVAWDVGLQRPYLDTRGRPCVDVLTGRMVPRTGADGKLITNRATGLPIYAAERKAQLIKDRWSSGLPAPTMNMVNNGLLRKDQWIMIDQAVIQSALPRMRAVADLRAAGLVFGGFDGMANPILAWERVSEGGEAVQNMDGMTDGGTNFQTVLDMDAMPLPLTYSDFFLSARFLAASRQRGEPLDVRNARNAGKRVGEKLEKVTIGVDAGVTAGTVPGYVTTAQQVEGYLTHPSRLTKTNFTAPTAGGWTGATTYNEILTALNQLRASNFFGPFACYYSTDWEGYLDQKYSTSEPSAGTLRENIQRIPDIRWLRRLDYMAPTTTNLIGTATTFTLLFVEMTQDNVELVDGMPLTTIQWETMGGQRLNFRVMTIQALRIRKRNINLGRATQAVGILQGTTA